MKNELLTETNVIQTLLEESLSSSSFRKEPGVKGQLRYLHAAVSDDLWHDAVEGQLLVEGLDALVSGVVELPGPIKVQNVPEHFRVSVEEILLCVFIVEKLLLRRAEQRVGVAVQRVLPRLQGKGSESNPHVHLSPHFTSPNRPH